MNDTKITTCGPTDTGTIAIPRRRCLPVLLSLGQLLRRTDSPHGRGHRRTKLRAWLEKAKVPRKCRNQLNKEGSPVTAKSGISTRSRLPRCGFGRDQKPPWTPRTARPQSAFPHAAWDGSDLFPGPSGPVRVRRTSPPGGRRNRLAKSKFFILLCEKLR